MTLERVPGFTILAVTDKNDLRIGDVARLCGVSPDTIRHYERLELLRGVRRTASGYRTYSDSDARRVLLVRNALAIGFRLRELSEILKSRDSGGLPCRDVREAVVDKLAVVDTQIEELKKFREQLRTVIKDWNEKLSQSDEDQPAHLLESLTPRRTK